MRGAVTSVILVATLAACVSPRPFRCHRDEQCGDVAAGAACEADGACSVADKECTSGRRYVGGPSSGGCVPRELADAAGAPDGPPTGDAPSSLDAPPGLPDASGSPDAQPAKPDALPPPDARPGEPDAPPPPDAPSAPPDAPPGPPDAPPAPVCGDGVCNGFESSCDCADCPDDPDTCSPCECGSLPAACKCDDECTAYDDCCPGACESCGYC